MKWLLSSRKFLPKAKCLSEGMWEEPRQLEFRHWPLCYTWIGYHRSMVRAWSSTVLRRGSQILWHQGVKSYIAEPCHSLGSSQMPSNVGKLVVSIPWIPQIADWDWVKGEAASAVWNTLDAGIKSQYHLQRNRCYTAREMWLVIIPQTKHDSSLAIAVLATFFLDRIAIL